MLSYSLLFAALNLTNCSFLIASPATGYFGTQIETEVAALPELTVWNMSNPFRTDN
jgi:hypothetical protein